MSNNGFSDQELDNINRAFQDADSDGSGSIDKSEMKGLLRKLNTYPGDTEFNKIFTDIDKDRSGTISFSEFLEAIRAMNGTIISEEALKRKFDRLDRDKQGWIGFKEIKQGFRDQGMFMSDSAISEMVMVVDTRGTGRITYEDFCQFAKAHVYGKKKQ